MLASKIIDRVKEVLQDANSVTWTEAQLIEWLNDAQRAVVSERPDATSITESMALVSGTKQLLPAGGSKLLKVVRNMGTDGATPGRAIKLVDQDTLDENSPDWHADTSAAVIKAYVFNESTDPKVFYVTPPSDASSQIEIAYSKNPADVAATTDETSVPDIYGPALIEWMCYRAFSRESINTPNYQRGLNHQKTFFNLLGVKMQADLAYRPAVGSEAG
ncbi:MAG: hypothetical protein PVJ68_10285 [Candidatus Thiodiazotropha sp.]|jgi:hypothetical protein